MEITKEILIDLHINQKKKICEISKILGISHPTIVNKYFKKYDIKVNIYRSRRSKNIKKEDLLHLHHDKKYNIKNIANHYNTSTKIILDWFKEYNITQYKYSSNKISSPSKDILIDLHIKNKKPFNEIAKIYDVGTKVVSRWFKEYEIKNISKRPPKYIIPAREEILNLHNNKKMQFNEIAKHYNVSNSTFSEWCGELDIECKYYGSVKTSKAELEILRFLQIFDPEAKKEWICKTEFDIFSKKYGFMIEYCGVYWHSTKFNSDRNRHKNKMDIAEKNGYQLLTIFENEWIEKEEIIKSIIKNKCFVSTRIFGRKTKIKQVNYKDVNLFYEKTHIQGKTTRIIKSYGLYENENLVACISFTRHPRNNSIVLGRYSSILGHTVIGGFSKLLKHYIKENNPDQIITWSDSRWSQGNLYEKTGFILDKILPPDYSYVNGQKLISKQSRQKKKIGCPDNITEKLFNEGLGLYQIYDCGKKRWILNLK